MTQQIKEVLIQAHQRLMVFKKASARAKEVPLPLHPEEFWEAADDEAITALESAINELNGVQVTPLPYEAAS